MEKITLERGLIDVCLLTQTLWLYENICEDGNYIDYSVYSKILHLANCELCVIFDYDDFASIEINKHYLLDELPKIDIEFCDVDVGIWVYSGLFDGANNDPFISYDVLKDADSCNLLESDIEIPDISHIQQVFYGVDVMLVDFDIELSIRCEGVES